MTAAPNQPAAPATPKPYAPAKRPRVDWRAVWPIPLAVLALAALVTGLVMAVLRAPKDDPAIPLAQARQHFNDERFADAIEVLNLDCLSFLNRGKMTEAQQSEFFALRARSLYFGQERLGIKNEANFKKVIDAYEEGRKRGMNMEFSDTSNLAEANLYTGNINKAIDLARTLSGRDDTRQVRIYEKIVNHELRHGSDNVAQILTLLAEMLDMPKLTIEQRAWVVARQTELRLNAGFAQEAIARLLRDLPKFEELSKETRGELMFLLGKAYAMDVDDGKAKEHLAGAVANMSQFDERRGEAMVIEARIAAKEGDNETAKEKFLQVREQFGETQSNVEALIGLGQASFALGDSVESLKAYTEAMELVKKHGTVRGIGFTTIGEHLKSHYEEKLLKNEPGEALDFARKAQEAFKSVKGGTAIPSDLLLSLAQANRRLAEAVMRDATGLATGRVTPADVSPVTATQAKAYLIDAGEHFREHARAVVATNYEQSMDSLFNAGDCFDLAGDAPHAIEAYSAFLSGARNTYPNQAEVMFRLAQVYESIGDYTSAAAKYQLLVDARNGGTTERGAAAWADLSLVPLARCFINEPRLATAATDTTVGAIKPNEQRALDLLKQVVAGRFGAPDSVQMRDALSELGNLYYRLGQYRDAIDMFNDYTMRYKDAPAKNPVLLFKLADAYRLLAQQLDREINAEGLSDKQAKAGLRQHHLRAARQAYQDAARAIAAKGGRTSKLEKLLARNSTFYIGDCSFLLGDYEQSIQEYARAREQYSADPSALMAMVQTVAAFIALDRFEDARTANERAKALLSAIPDEVWNDPTRMLPMERRHWEGWLKSRLELDGGKTATPAETPAENTANADEPGR